MLIRSESEMLEYGKNYAAKLEIPAVIELIGDVGAGKTTFVRGLAQGLGINEPLRLSRFLVFIRAKKQLLLITIFTVSKILASWRKIWLNLLLTKTMLRSSNGGRVLRTFCHLSTK